jgi:hypothetical protein
MQSILAGTIDGIFHCQGQNRTWMVKHKTLDGQEVPCIAVQPHNRNHVYAGTRDGGLFKSLDGGGKWEKIGAETLRGKIRSLASILSSRQRCILASSRQDCSSATMKAELGAKLPACAKSSNRKYVSGADYRTACSLDRSCPEDRVRAI